ncbi:hypothetical protein BPO_1930 [Bergeyella porcorum]|uniref:Stage III sporulation protein AG n=1 Tax=Bergeyella porcorum TaxID=1735111 RepID=A0AAU0F390_9FLAO
MKNQSPQDKYTEILQDIKEEKMNWDFEDFLKEVEAKEEKIIPIQRKEPRKLLYKTIGLAASIAVILGIFFLFQKDESNTVAPEQMIATKEEVWKKASEAWQQEALQDSATVLPMDSEIQHPTAEKEAEQVMNKILPKRERIKKNIRQRYAVTQSNKEAKSTEYQEDFVIINGQKIKNEEEAMEVTRYSLQVLSDKVSETIASVSTNNNDDY